MSEQSLSQTDPLQIVPSHSNPDHTDSNQTVPPEMDGGQEGVPSEPGNPIRAATKYFYEKLGEERVSSSVWRQAEQGFRQYVVNGNWDSLRIYIDYGFQDPFWAEQITDVDRFLDFLSRDNKGNLRSKAKAWYRARQAKNKVEASAAPINPATGKEILL